MFQSATGLAQRRVMLLGYFVALYSIVVCLYYAMHYVTMLLTHAVLSTGEAVPFIIIEFVFAIAARIGIGLATLYPSFRLEEKGIRLRFLAVLETTLDWGQISEISLPASPDGAVALILSSRKTAPWRIENLPLYRLNGLIVKTSRPVLLLFPDKSAFGDVLSDLHSRISRCRL